MITLNQFRAILPNCKEPGLWVQLLGFQMPAHGFRTKEQIAAFIAQCAHESGEFNVLVENLNYSADRLKIIFPKYFRTFSENEMRLFHRNPQAIANVVYANRMGNGDRNSGEGFKFRGRGVLQVTGKANYMRCSAALFEDDNVLLDEPDYMLEPTNALASALWYWSSNKLLQVTNFVELTKRVNGGTNGLQHRQELFNRALLVLNR